MLINPLKIFLIFLRLGLLSFGGPIAHLGYFRTEFVSEKKWLTDEEFSEVVALCQFLPGPASSQTGITIGLLRGGYLGAFAAWLGFTLPSAAIMIAFAIGISNFNIQNNSGLFKGLKIAGCAVVLHACYNMAKQLCPDPARKLLALTMAGLVIVFNQLSIQISVIFISGGFGLIYLKDRNLYTSGSGLVPQISKKHGAAWLISYSVLFTILAATFNFTESAFVQIMIHFFQTGSLVFGGGHVVLPLLQNFLSHNGQMSNEIFMSGYGLAQALPGPLFTIAAFLGASVKSQFSPIVSGLIGCFMIFIPSFFLVFSALPFWYSIKKNEKARHVISGVNAGIVGLLIAALFNPLLTTAVQNVQDFILFTFAALILFFTKLNVVLTVGFCAVFGFYFLSF